MITSVRIPIIKRYSGYFLRWYYNGWHYWQFYPGALNYKTEGENYRTYGTRSVTMSSGPLTEAQSEAVRTVLNTREVYLFTDNGWAAVRIETGQAEIKNTLTTGCEVNFKAIIGSRMLSVTGFSPVVDVPISQPDDQCEVTIGTQIWMCKNWDADYPASKVYSDTEANRVVYGGLYTYDQVMSAGFVPDGWHVPTLAEWNTLLDALGGFATAGGDLKTAGTDYWDSPNTGADDSSGLSFKGSGFYLSSVGFAGLKTVANIWTASPVSGTHAYAIQLEYDDEDATANALNKLTYCAVRLVKNEAASLSFDDWFLPSKFELQAMKTELHDQAVGGFVSGIYLSSYEVSATHAYAKGFDSGMDWNVLKGTAYNVRACRAFTTTTIYAVRDTGPAGGLVFYKSGNDYMEAAPSDVANAAFSDVSLLIGTTLEAIGTGQANTTAIINQVGHTASAAKLCDELTIP